MYALRPVNLVREYLKTLQMGPDSAITFFPFCQNM